MKSDLHVATPPPKPLMIFDGDCGFCKLWIGRWRQSTGEQVEYVPLQDPSVAENYPELCRAQLESAVHLIEPDAAVYSGAEAVFRALAVNPRRQRGLRWYCKSPAFASLSDRAYRFVAEHRTLFSWVTRIGWGRHVERPMHFLVRWVLLRALALIYLIAFVSLWTQVLGLVGSDGILPAQQTMSAVEHQTTLQGLGLERFVKFPTLCWFNASDNFLLLQCAAGAILAVTLLLGFAPAPCLFLLWLIYLSLATVCREFLGFQWDNLLLEAGFLAIFLAPLQLWPRPSRESGPSRLVVWLLRWLLFRLMFESGCVKLLSGDETWRHLTALTFHYETQPLPTWIGWWAHQLPVWFQKTSCGIMFAIELVAPFFIFAPRRIRFLAGGAIVSLQVLILLTGNYTFFNWLTIALCVLLLDDFALTVVPGRVRNWFSQRRGDEVSRLADEAKCFRWPRFVTVPLAVIIIPISLFQLAATFRVQSRWLTPLAVVDGWVSPLRSLNNYGLFAVMTRPRYEIIVDGSNDGQTWKPYEFKYKPGRVGRRPGFVAPFQPRLDWQMWFAALGTWRDNPWFISFCVRLLQGSPQVLSLLDGNPFPEKPPEYVRARLYEYHFTTPVERRKTGDWWRRELKGEYLPAISLKDIAGG